MRLLLPLVLWLGLTAAAAAQHSLFSLDTEYPRVVMTGCLSQAAADKVAKAGDAGPEHYSQLKAQSLCGFTLGPTTFVQVFGQYHFNTLGVWYVEYRLRMQDGTYETFWGFSKIEVRPKPTGD